MLCLSGFDLYSRWVPLLVSCLPFGSIVCYCSRIFVPDVSLSVYRIKRLWYFSCSFTLVFGLLSCTACFRPCYVASHVRSLSHVAYRLVSFCLFLSLFYTSRFFSRCSLFYLDFAFLLNRFTFTTASFSLRFRFVCQNVLVACQRHLWVQFSSDVLSLLPHA